MVIHDLKHPTELVISSLDRVHSQLKVMESHIYEMEAKKDSIKEFENQLHKKIKKIEFFLRDVCSLINSENISASSKSS